MLKIFAMFCFGVNHYKSIRADYNNFIQDHESTLYEKTNFTNYVGEVIYAHRESEIILHFDSTNMNLVDKIMKNVNSRVLKSVNLICYGQDVENRGLFERPLVQKILNVVVLQELENFSLFLDDTENVSDQDEALFIIPYKEINTTFLTTNYEVRIFGKVLVVYINMKLGVNIDSLCYFCGKLSKKLSKIATSGIEAIGSKFYFDKKVFNDFQKHVFKVGFTEYFPFIWCEEAEERITENRTLTVCIKPKGSEYDLIKLVAKRLNFTFVLVMYLDYTPLINDLENAKIDFIIGGITVTSERAKRATFSRQYMFEGYHFLYVHTSDVKHELRRVLDPFDGTLWLLLVTTIFVTSVMLYAFDRVDSTGVMSISCSDSLWVCIYMAIEQNVNIKQVFRVRTGPAVLLVAWVLVCFNLSTAYKSKLSALVMNPPHREPSSLEELVESGYKFVVNERYRDVFLALLVNTSDSVVQSAAGCTETRNGLCEEFLFAVEEHAAILDEYTSLQFELRKNCKGELRAKRLDTENLDGTKIRITRKSLRIIGQVWLLQKRVAYRTGFDKVLGEIVEAGLVEMWKRDYIKLMIRGSFPESRNSNMSHQYSRLSLRLLLSLFLVYGLGNCFAVIVFAIESLFCKKALEPVSRRISLEDLKM